MVFQKGRKRTGGNKKGSTHKKTGIKNMLSQWSKLGERVEGVYTDSIIEWMDKLPPDKLFIALKDIFEYFKPKLSRSETHIEIEERKKIDIIIDDTRRIAEESDRYREEIAK